MIDKLKTFVNRNKQEFDTNEPGKDLWNKIDARMEVKNSSGISSKWLSKLKYLGLSASVLVVSIYVISKNLHNSAANELVQSRKDSALNNSGEWIKANQNRSGIIENKNASTNVDNMKSKSESSLSVSSGNNQQSVSSIDNSKENTKKDSVIIKSSDNIVLEQNQTKSEVHPLAKEENKQNYSTKEIDAVKNNKKIENSVIEEEKINTYSGTILDGSSFCSIIRAYKFPGQVSMEGTMKTMGCSKLESINNLKAVCLKGKTAKKIELSLKEGFKNIILEKSDGRKLNPEAISHYYTGLSVICGYTGKYFDMIFKDKVEIILFFKDVEVGDKISIDGTIEALVKNKL